MGMLHHPLLAPNTYTCSHVSIYLCACLCVCVCVCVRALRLNLPRHEWRPKHLIAVPQDRRTRRVARAYSISIVIPAARNLAARAEARGVKDALVAQMLAAKLP